MHCYGWPQHALGGGAVKINVTSILCRCTFVLPQQQKVQNAAARVTFQIAKFDHTTPALIDLHWLPVTFRVQFKLLLLVYKSLHNQSPSYITDLLSVKPAANYAFRSSAKSPLFVPKVNCTWGSSGLYSCCTCFMELAVINYKNK